MEKATGNGVVMKLAPLALYYHLTKQINVQTKIQQVALVTNMTHRNAMQCAAACTHVWAMEYLLDKSQGNNGCYGALKQQRVQFLQFIIDVCVNFVLITF